MMSMKWTPLVAALAVLLPSAAMAESDWTYKATFYGWFPGIKTTVATPVGEVEGEVEFDEVLEDLDMAFLGAIEARKGRVAVIGDLQFFDIGVEAHPPKGLLFKEAEIDSKMVVFNGYATYAVVDKPDFRVELGGGVRYVDASIETHLTGISPTPNLRHEADGSFADLLIAARMTKQFNDKWHAFAYADVGGFGLGDSSDLTWQASFGQSYKLGDTWSVVGGYRHLSIERKFKKADVTTEVSGPFLGFQKKF